MGIYNSLLLNHPIKTKVATCALIAALGDLGCQQFTVGKADNYQRTAFMAGTAGLLQTPVFHLYTTSMYPRIKANSFARLVGMRWAAHIGLMTPMMNVIMLFTLGALQTKTLKGGSDKLKSQFVDTMKGAYIFWPLVLLGLYALPIPIRFANLYTDTFSLAWSGYVSFKANESTTKIQ